MPGHIGTDIVANSRKVLSGDESDTLSEPALAQARTRFTAMGLNAAKLSDADIQAMIADRVPRFRDEAPTTAAQAATIILDAVKADRWRVLVGRDAEVFDAQVRADPEHAYDLDFFQNTAREAGWRLNAL
jgi:hypothetical protein